MKNENENGKETETQGSSTPEISARSRQSLDGFTAQREDEKEIKILQYKRYYKSKVNNWKRHNKLSNTVKQNDKKPLKFLQR